MTYHAIIDAVPGFQAAQIHATYADQKSAVFRVDWRLNTHSLKKSLRTLDIILILVGKSQASADAPPTSVSYVLPKSQNKETNSVNSSVANDVFARLCTIALTANTGVGATIVLSTRTGYPARSDYIHQRFLDCPFTAEVVDFLTVGHKVAAFEHPSSDASSLPDILASAAGCLFLRDASPDTFSAVQSELTSRLPATWLLPSPTQRRKLALVDVRQSFSGGEGFIRAARGLNASLVVIGQNKHSLQDPSNDSDFCEAFLPIDITIDDLLPRRIADAIQAYNAVSEHPIEHITTLNDLMLVSVAKAAALLDFPASPVSAHEVCVDKYATRLLTAEEDQLQAFRFSGMEELRERLSADDSSLAKTLEYPLIVKPVKGWSSEGVFKVNNLPELYDAVSRIDTERHGHSLVVETFIVGPEFDANMVLCNGEIVFFELTDDFPSEGDSDTASASSVFFETSDFLPSGLSSEESDVVRHSLHSTLLRLGFQWGIFHMEGRVRNSRSEYKEDETGIVDLQSKKIAPTALPTCFLIEINTRIPGHPCSFATMHTYGVDFYAIQIACALRDAPLVKLLSSPFAFPGRPEGSQYWCETLFIPTKQGGAYNSGDACQELLEKHPRLEKHVAKMQCFYRKGDVVPDASTGILLLIAYFLVYSTESRAHVRRLAQFIRHEISYEVL